jgi:hypothetical protein
MIPDVDSLSPHNKNYKNEFLTSSSIVVYLHAPLSSSVQFRSIPYSIFFDLPFFTPTPIRIAAPSIPQRRTSDSVIITGEY